MSDRFTVPPLEASTVRFESAHEKAPWQGHRMLSQTDAGRESQPRTCCTSARLLVHGLPSLAQVAGEGSGWHMPAVRNTYALDGKSSGAETHVSLPRPDRCRP